MKKIYSALTLVLLCFVSKAQYTITAASNPVIGDLQKTWDLDTTGLGFGTSGANQAWNYTNIVISPTTTIRIASFVSPSVAPSSTMYPSANIASTTDNSTYEMLAYTNSNVAMYGVTSSSFSMVYQDAMTFITFPFTYSSVCSDTFSGTIVAGGSTINVNGSSSVTADGYGTLSVPGNSFTNVLRLKTQTILSETFGATSLGTVTTVGYSYYSAVNKFPLLSISTNTNASPTNTTLSKSGTVSHMVLQGIKEQNGRADFGIYPNPAINKELILSYNLMSSENYIASIYNSIGQKMIEVDLGERNPGAYRDKIDLGNLQTGIYFVRLKGKNSQGVQKLIIQ